MISPTTPIEDFAFSEDASLQLPLVDGKSLTIESSTDQISFLRDFDIRRDQQGLALSIALLKILRSTVDVMTQDMQDGKLPETLTIQKPVEKTNPFA